MIHVKNTPNNTGVAIYGDHLDFENLYEALHKVVGDENEFVGYEQARFRVLGVCYDIRHALMGDREIEFVDNGIDQDKMRRLSVLAPNMNVYLKINVLWPEMLFVNMALNEFLQVYAKKQAKSKYSLDLFTETKVIWQRAIAQVRMLQAEVAECLKRTVTEATYARMLNVMNGRYVSFRGYLTQYLDILNDDFLGMDKEKRLKNISKVAKQLVECGKEYRDLELQIREQAIKYNCGVNELSLNIDFPDYIEW